jgi:hypothetical protein
MDDIARTLDDDVTMFRARSPVPLRIVAAAVAAAAVAGLATSAGAARTGGPNVSSSLVLQRRDVAGAFAETAGPVNAVRLFHLSAAEARTLHIVAGYDVQFSRPQHDASKAPVLPTVFGIESQAILFRSASAANRVLSALGSACALYGLQAFDTSLGDHAAGCGGAAPTVGSIAYLFWRDGRLDSLISLSSTDGRGLCRLQQLALTLGMKQQTEILRSSILPAVSKKPPARAHITCSTGPPSI